MRKNFSGLETVSRWKQPVVTAYVGNVVGLLKVIELVAEDGIVPINAGENEAEITRDFAS